MAGPQHKEFRKEILQVMQVGGAPTREIRKEILQAMQVGGAPTQRISKRNSTGNASWGRTGINFAKISFLFPIP